ncbi:MAG: DUF1365 family protein [Rhodospirillales bacterium]|nr:DUF1365 family protein [Rhodospirillales bacterium]
MSGSAIYTGAVVHTRLRPVRHRLRYRMFSLLLDLDEIPELSARLRWFSAERFNLVGFSRRDHLAGDATPLRTQVEAALAASGIEARGGRILLLAMPRVLGTVFNPLSLFLCHDAEGALRAVLYEVNNTFGQRHSYLIPVSGADRPVHQSCAKTFFVSPFMDMGLRYRFRLVPPGERLAVAIEASDAAGPVLKAAMALRRQPLTDAALLAGFVRHPLLAAQVLGAIHWEAAKLWRKGLRIQARPAPPAEPISIVARGGTA